MNLGEEAFFKKVKMEFGLVPFKDESIEEFQQRAYETINLKDDATKSFLFRNLNKSGRYSDILPKAQTISQKYLKIISPVIDAFEFKLSEELNVGGLSYGENDGSSVVGVPPLRDNFRDIIDLTSQSLEDIILEGNSVEIKDENFLYRESGFREDNSLDKLAWNLYQHYLKNPDFVLLHEVTHAIHTNNHDLGRRGAVEDVIKAAIKYRLPLIGLILKMNRFNFHVETETLAYNIAFDEITSDVIDLSLSRLERRMDKDFSEESCYFKTELSERNSKLSKTIIKYLYLGDSGKGYGLWEDNYGSAILNGMCGGLLVSQPSLLLSILGGFLLYKASEDTLKVPISYYFSRKIDEVGDIFDRVVDYYGDAGESFNHILGMSFDEMHNKIVKGRGF